MCTFLAEVTQDHMWSVLVETLCFWVFFGIKMVAMMCKGQSILNFALMWLLLQNQEMVTVESGMMAVKDSI